MASDSKLSDTLSTVSEEILPKRVRPRLTKLLDEMDQLLFLDNTDELAVDRDTLMRIASNGDLVPPSLRDIVILETSKYLGRRVKGLGKGRRITWRDGEKYGLPIHPASKADLRAWGIGKTTSIDELGVILKAQWPEIPDFWTNQDSTELADAVLRNLMANRTVWDCLVANLGWWAAVLVGGVLLIFIIVGLSAGWQLALLIAIIYTGALTAYTILQCVADAGYNMF